MPQNAYTSPVMRKEDPKKERGPAALKQQHDTRMSCQGRTAVATQCLPIHNGTQPFA